MARSGPTTPSPGGLGLPVGFLPRGVAPVAPPFIGAVARWRGNWGVFLGPLLGHLAHTGSAGNMHHATTAPTGGKVARGGGGLFPTFSVQKSWGRSPGAQLRVRKGGSGTAGGAFGWSPCRPRQKRGATRNPAAKTRTAQGYLWVRPGIVGF